jgi:chromosome segregation ATPase
MDEESVKEVKLVEKQPTILQRDMLLDEIARLRFSISKFQERETELKAEAGKWKVEAEACQKDAEGLLKEIARLNKELKERS